MDLRAAQERTRYDGAWWLPGDQQSAYGDLGVKAMRLVVQGKVVGLGNHFEGIAVPVIYGRSGSIDITLLNCRSAAIDENAIAGEVYGQAVYAETALIGAQLDPASMAFSRARWHIVGLNEWAGRRPFDYSDDMQAIVRLSIPRLRADIGDGVALTLSQHGWGTLPTGHTVTMERNEYFAVSLKTAAKLDDLERSHVAPTEQFMSLCSGNNVVRTEFQVLEPGAEDERSGEWLDVKRAALDRGFPRREHNIGPLMPLPLREGTFPTLLLAWFSLLQKHNLQSICETLFSPATDRLPPHARLMALAAAAEALHFRLFTPKDKPPPDFRAARDRILSMLVAEDRAWLRARLLGTHRPPFVQRLRELLDVVRPSVWGLYPNVDAWSNEVLNKPAIRMPIQPRDVPSPVRLDQLSDSLDLLMRAVLFDRLGFAEKDLSGIISLWMALARLH